MLSDRNEMFTGVEVSYYVVCKTKLWLFYHHIYMESGNENVKIGKEIHKNTYKNEKKEVDFLNIKLDFIRKDNTLEVHEIKKSNKLEKAHIAQVLYYLSNFDSLGINAIGFLDYPETNRHKKIYLDDDGKNMINDILNGINKVVNNKMPLPEHKNYCKSCAYFDFCWC